MKITDGLHAFIWESMVENNCNSYLITGEKNILIDPGHAHLFDHVKNGLDHLNIGLEDIGLVVCTHPHPDHIEAVQFFKDLPAEFALHREAWEMMTAMAGHLSARGIDIYDMKPNVLMEEGPLRVNNVDLQIIYTPGHAPGSVSIYGARDRVLFTGDVIFPQGLGRTDLPGGNGNKLKDSIRRLAELDVEFLCAGHGNVLIGGEKVRDNFAEVMNYWFQYI